jgi:single-stranded DNA-binding protein
MSLFILATGSLILDPKRHTSNGGNIFATATIRAATDEGPALISAIAFGDQVQALLSHRQGSAIAVSGRAKLTEWTGRDSKQNHGLSVVVEQIASASAARRADADRRRGERP